MGEVAMCSRTYFTKEGAPVEVKFMQPSSREDAWPVCTCEIDYCGKVTRFSVSGSDTLDAFFGAVKMVKFNLEQFAIEYEDQLTWLYEPGILGMPVSYDCPD